jgi:hypothetical protein
VTLAILVETLLAVVTFPAGIHKNTNTGVVAHGKLRDF